MCWSIRRANLRKKNSSKTLSKKSSVILFEGESTRQKLLSLGAKEEKLTAIKFGVNALNPEKPLNNKKATSKHPSMHNVRLLSNRNLEPIYDITTILTAVNLLKTRGVNFALSVYGTGVLEKSLKERVKELELSSHVTFYGQYNLPQAHEIYDQHDIFISASLSDSGLSTSICEAIEHGLPVVISKSGDNANTFRHGTDALLFECGDYHACAENLFRLITNPHFASSLNTNALEIIKTHHSWMNTCVTLDKSGVFQ